MSSSQLTFIFFRGIETTNQSMGDLQDPEMEVLYHILGHINCGIFPEE
jgi:hypothetical protein